MKTSMYVAASMDGFIARPDGSIDWLGSAEEAADDYDYREFYASVDALVMGGKTYRQVAAFPDWPYQGKPVWVYSRGALDPEIPGVRRADVGPAELIQRLRREGRAHLWVLGGGDIHAMFLREELVDEIRLFVMPLALGVGVPLFAPPVPERRWRLAGVRQWPHGVAGLRYTRD